VFFCEQAGTGYLSSASGLLEVVGYSLLSEYIGTPWRLWAGFSQLLALGLFAPALLLESAE